MFGDDICTIVIFMLIQAWWQNGEDCVTMTPSHTSGCELMPFFSVPLALTGSCFLCAASLLHLHLSQPTSLNLMYSDVGMFKRGMVYSDRGNRIHRKQCPPCCPPAGSCGKTSPERTDEEEKHTGHLGWRQEKLDPETALPSEHL